VRLDGYVRVSRVGGRTGDSFISPDVQRERLRASAKVAGHRILRIHEDLDLPGTHSARPGLQAALQRVEAGQIDGLIVAKLDRFGRSAIDIHRNLERIREAGGELLTAAEGIDTSTPIGRFFLTIVAGFAELEIERIGENWRAARTRAVDRGVHISGHTPRGYSRLDDGRLAIDAETAPAVSAAFAMRAENESWKRIADWLTEEGVPTTHGSPQWTIATVRSMVRNRVYLGEARSGDLVKIRAHKALVEPHVWEKANRRRGAHLESTGNVAGVLSGLLRCAGCSFALKPKMSKTRHGKPRREYTCRPDKAAGRCPSPASVTAERVEAPVIEQFFRDYGEIRLRAHRRSDERHEIERRLAVGRAELEAALDERLVEALGGENSTAYIEMVRRRREAVEKDEDALAALDDMAPELPDLAAIEEGWPTFTLVQRRTLLGAAYDAIYLRRATEPREPTVNRLRFFDIGTGPPTPTRGQRGEIRSVNVE
jgi:site-specific DNA recombinase